jgi:hypothetical protein
MVYIMMGVNVLIGLFFVTGFDMGSGDSILYSSGVLVDPVVWGVVLLVTSLIGLYGLAKGQAWATRTSGLGGSLLWLFASISLLQAAHWYILLTIGLFHLCFHIYILLATATGSLYRTSFGR